MRKRMFFMALVLMLAGTSFGARAMLTEEEQLYYKEKRAEEEAQKSQNGEPQTDAQEPQAGESQADEQGTQDGESQADEQGSQSGEAQADAQGSQDGDAREPQTGETENTAPAVEGEADDAPLVALDPGHQAPDYCVEDGVPNGPGSETMRAGMSPGTSGTVSGLSEYELDLTVSLQLKEELIRRGYRVVMTRETQEVSLTDIERCEIANEAQADILIHIHANTSEDAGITGAMVTAPSNANPYVSEHYNSSMKLSDDLLDTYCEVTGLNNRGIYESDNLTSINWSQVPVTVLELGYMTNPQDDAYMADAENQKIMVKGLADGIDKYFGRQGE